MIPLCTHLKKYQKYYSLNSLNSLNTTINKYRKHSLKISKSFLLEDHSVTKYLNSTKLIIMKQL